jgi:hypothetical protein
MVTRGNVGSPNEYAYLPSTENASNALPEVLP